MCQSTLTLDRARKVWESAESILTIFRVAKNLITINVCYLNSCLRSFGRKYDRLLNTESVDRHT